ncbi:hypothetical protein [Lentzea miocenica]|uniref:hypothetical protein n=1 Tax=Lentzea miocenica TaxID=3095431 RepID=UPI003873B29C
MGVDELGDALRYGPFHRALRVAIDRRGLSLFRLRAHLARMGLTVAESTLSYWQRGLRRPGPRERVHEAASTSFIELSPLGPTTTELLASLVDDPARCNAGLEVALTQERIRPPRMGAALALVSPSPGRRSGSRPW